ncbi:hypothetical protein [Bdellovibrio svalbardensis]|uniref:OmpH family outer membrane protein n=1 Tax=Bdellovibrio svalbardensis TaxID=2972972 RepID=A0ABT6DD26_9BACT|nr:hypothetical protein [Bdellovibrio svalbardensis]MDG0814747.1 hypothetical protein [Bdellovibrio svalbardensis]
MSSENANKEEKDSSKLLALLLFLGAGVMAFLYLGSDGTKKKFAEISATVKSEKYEKAVNKHLMVTNETMAMARQRMEIENARLAKDFDATSAQPVYAPPQGGVDLSSDSRAAEIANELGRGDKRAESFENPNDVVQKELFNQQQQAEYSKAYKEEYVRQFIENARRGGYKVKIGEDFKVLSVTPIRSPSDQGGGDQDILNSNGEALQ